MLLSIIIPAYNCQDTIENIIINIEKLETKDKEIIIVNDGSIDDTDKICLSLLNKYSDIRYFKQNNTGVSSARNNGLKQAKGDYVVFLDSDDSFDVINMNNMIDFIKVNKHIDMLIYGLSFDYYYHGKCYRRDIIDYSIEGILDQKKWLIHLNILYNTNALSPIWNKIIRRSLLIDNKIEFNSDMIIYEDLDFSLKCLSYCNDIYITSKCIYHYRQSEDEGNAKRRLKRIDDLLDIINPIEQSLNLIYKNKDLKIDKKIVDEILVKLYFILFKDKIAVIKRNQYRKLASFFIDWMNNRNIKQEDILSKIDCQLIDDVFNCRYIKLLIRSVYINVRHKIAIIVKSCLNRGNGV